MNQDEMRAALAAKDREVAAAERAVAATEAKSAEIIAKIVATAKERDRAIERIGELEREQPATVGDDDFASEVERLAALEEHEPLAGEASFLATAAKHVDDVGEIERIAAGGVS